MQDVVKLCSSFCASRPAPSCKSSEPAIYLPLDEIKGNKSPGVGADATLYGSHTLVNGHKNKGIHFSNTGTYDDNYLNIGSFSGQCINDIDKCKNGYTVSFWFNEDDGNHAWPVLASASDWQVWNQDSVKGNAPYISWFKNDGYRYVGGGNTYLTNEEWHHVAVVARSRTDVSFYVNGVKDTSSSTTMRQERVETITKKDIEFGCYKRSNCIAAAFDEIKIWEEAKSDDEIMDIYKGRYRR